MCNKDNHFHIKCPEKKHREKSHRPTKHKSVRTVDDYSYHYQESESTDEEIIYISEEVLNVDSKLQEKLYATMEVEDNLVKFQIDSGATCNILPSKYTPSAVYDSESYQSTSHKLSMYNDSSLNAKGTCILKLRNPKNRKKHRVKFYIVDGVTTPILGAQAIQHMELIKVQPQNILQVQENTNTLDKFKDVFEGQGTFSGELNLEIDYSIHPVKSPLRRVPIALRKPLKEELIKLESKRIIQKVETPTDWISILVVVKKPSRKL